MKKKLGRLFRPGLIACFVVMFLFGGAALWFKQYQLALVEFVLTAGMLLFYLFDRKRRNREILAFIQSTFDTADLTEKGAESPLPMALVRLGDGGIVWASDRFARVTGYRPRVPELGIGDVLPGMTME